MYNPALDKQNGLSHMSTHPQNILELEQGACLYWPKNLMADAAKKNPILSLLNTQDHFLGLLKSADKNPLSWRDALYLSASLSPNLFLKHLMMLSDIGGERLQRFSRDFDLIFPTGSMEFCWRGNTFVYDFIGKKNSWNNKNLYVEKSVIFKNLDALTNEMLDVCMMLLWAGFSRNSSALPQEIIEKCIIGGLIGNPVALEDFVRKRYLYVSRMSGGSLANDLGKLCEKYVVDFLKSSLPSHILIGAHTIDDVSHNDKNLTTFDVVAKNTKTNQCVAIEISFQVTTNSVIERKAGLAKSRQDLLHKKNHKVAYIIDGSGNFQRKNAIQTILNFCDCAVNFSEAGLHKISDFIVRNTND